MLLELTRWLSTLDGLFGLFGLFGYITVRGILATLTALALALLLGPTVIRRLAVLKGQPIRSDGPQTHLTKAGTPTMGGALILLSVSAATLLWGDLRNRYVWLVLAVLLGFGLRGKVGAGRVLGYSLAGSLLFFVLTNAGVWAFGSMYPHNAAGLAAAFVAGIPFFQWTVLGTLFYSALLFGGFELLRWRLPALRAQTA